MTLHDREQSVLFHTYKRLPLEVERGEGVYLFTHDGKKYLDMFSGLAVNALGYAHPAVVRAIAEQAARYTHLSNYYLQAPQIQLAELLTQAAGYDRVFLSNSGTEAIEGMMKLVRKWGTGHGKSDIVAMSNSFHGRTFGALSLMDRPKYREGFGPFLENCHIATFNDPAALFEQVDNKTAAVVLEFIQGEGGIRPVSAEFIKTVEELRRKFGFLLVGDEIQAGIGRTGKFFSFQHYNVRPDIVVVAKPIGGGLPLGGILANEQLASLLEPGMHGTTFGGNPVACAAGIAVLKEIAGKNLMQRAEAMGTLLLDGLRSLAHRYPGIVQDVRGKGLMVGAELDRDAEPVVTAMRNHGILINGTDRTVLRFLPPLIITAEHVQSTVDALGEVFATL
ncbi:MAG: acetylornithine/succinylornithine family transaminase [Bacteroidota bacterium]